MLVPREHGAYGQILFPVVAALLIGSPAAAAYLLAVAGTAAFLGHESLLVLLGQRGGRAARELRADAWRSLALFGGLATVSGVAALLLLPGSILPMVLVPAVLAVCVGVVVAVGRERTTGGEVLVAIALSSASLPVARAGGVEPGPALTLFVVFSVVFVTATVSVRALIGRTAKARGPSPMLAGVVSAGAIAGLAVLSMRGTLAPVAPYAALPVCAVALGLTVSPPAPRHLRTIGWTLVGSTAAAALLLVAAL